MLYPSYICDIPLVRGDCGYPSRERLIVEVVLVSLFVKRWIVIVWLCAYPSFVRLILVALCLGSVRGCIRLREELCTPVIVLPQILSGGSLCGKSCVDELVKIFLCEGGVVELCARTSKPIRVLAIDPLSLNSLSFTLCIYSYCHIIYMLGLFVCAHTCI